MPRAIKVSPGDKIHMLTIIRELHKYEDKRYFECLCDCGKTTRCRFVSMRSGETKSCGCLRDSQNRTVGLTHGLSATPLYNSWHSMKQRCLNEKSANYHYYGERGITVCEEWKEFEPFRDWALKNGYADNLTIERDDFNGNYEPGNCRWIPQSEQSQNTRRTIMIEFDGLKLCVKHWANKLGISNTSMQKRLKAWPIERALTEPINIRYES